MTLHFDESTDLSGLDVAIRLKADLLLTVAKLPTRSWPEEVARFVSALERADIRDATALVVLLIELREELRLMTAIGEPRTESSVAGLAQIATTTWAGLPPASILAKFRDQIVRLLLPLDASRKPLSPIVQRTKSIMDTRYAEPLKLDDLAAAVRRSKRYLGTLFQRESGMTMHAYLTHVRMRRALDLIRRGEKIEAVSLLVGYRSKANFYRHFRAHTGVTPRAYRAALFHMGGDA